MGGGEGGKGETLFLFPPFKLFLIPSPTFCTPPITFWGGGGRGGGLRVVLIFPFSPLSPFYSPPSLCQTDAGQEQTFRRGTEQKPLLAFFHRYIYIFLKSIFFLIFILIFTIFSHFPYCSPTRTGGSPAPPPLPFFPPGPPKQGRLRSPRSPSALFPPARLCVFVRAGASAVPVKGLFLSPPSSSSFFQICFLKVLISSRHWLPSRRAWCH